MTNKGVYFYQYKHGENSTVKIEILSGKTAWQDAKHKATYGHKPYIAWVENDTPHAARMTEETLKRAMLATGTQGFMVQYYSGSMIIHWPIACVMLRNLKKGYVW